MELIKPNQIALGEGNYEIALDTVMAQAKEQLLIFDQDLSKGAYTSIKRHETMKALFINRQAKITMVLQNASFFRNNCYRLLDLLKHYSHQFTVFETNDQAKAAKDMFILADGQHYLRRFHVDQARFKYAMHDEKECTALNHRFEDLLAETSYQLTATTLGL